MHALFVTVATAGLGYFLFAKRQFDYLSLAYLGACVYFLPGFVGHVLDPSSRAPRERSLIPIVSEAYLIMIVVLLAILVAGIVRQMFAPPAHVTPSATGKESPYPKVAFAFALVGFAMTLLTIGSGLHEASKTVVLGSLNRWYILWITATSLAALLGYSYGHRAITYASLCLLLYDVYIGFRFSFAVVAMSIFALHLSRQGPQRIAIERWKIGLLGILISTSVFTYKSIYVFVKLRRWDLVAEILTAPGAFREVMLASEPFITQAILNELIKNDFTVGMGHLAEVALQFIAFTDLLGVEAASFSDMFMNSLFGGVEGGLASNIWGEMWSAGGWTLLIVFLGVFVSVLAWGSRFLGHSSPMVRGGSALMLSLWAFYFHRNTLAYQLNMEKRFAIVWLLTALIGLIIIRLSSMDISRSDLGPRSPRHHSSAE